MQREQDPLSLRFLSYQPARWTNKGRSTQILKSSMHACILTVTKLWFILTKVWPLLVSEHDFPPVAFRFQPCIERASGMIGITYRLSTFRII